MGGYYDLPGLGEDPDPLPSPHLHHSVPLQETGLDPYARPGSVYVEPSPEEMWKHGAIRPYHAPQYMTDHMAQFYECSACGAKWREPCRTRGGRRTQKAHVARQSLARQLIIFVSKVVFEKELKYLVKQEGLTDDQV